jgi:hypothetical protein
MQHTLGLDYVIILVRDLDDALTRMARHHNLGFDRPARPPKGSGFVRFSGLFGLSCTPVSLRST